jgi:hypothetical protein
MVRRARSENMYVSYVVTCWSGGRTAIFGTGASNGSFESAADDKMNMEEWWNGN